MSRRTLAAIGDSQSDYEANFGVDAFGMWMPVLSDVLAAEGITNRGRAFGISGETSTQNLARADVLFYYDTPDVAVIYTGVNDPGASIAQATTQANIQAMVKVAKFKAIGQGLASGCTVATQASLPAAGKLGQRYVVLSDTSSTGGAAAWHSSQAATITGAGGSAQTVWEYRYGAAGELGWGRIATAATTPDQVKRIVVVTANYLNFTTGGDTPSTPYTTYAPVRAAQAAAVTAENVAIGGVASVVLADLYTLMRNRIVAGTDPNFSADTAIVPTTAYSQALSWHEAQNNQHHDAYGQTLVAAAVRQAMPAAWITALAS